MKSVLIAFVVWSAVVTAAAADVASYLARTPFLGGVVVERSGERLYQQGDDQVAYEIGSITKVFTAVAVLRLQERGLLSIRDAISKYLPYPHGNEITVESLLDHTSGIPDYFNEVEDVSATLRAAQSSSSLEDLTALFRERPLHFTPGSEYRYSNSNYILLGRILELVSGKSYADCIADEVLLPGGLSQTGVMVVPSGVSLAEGHGDTKGLPPGFQFNLTFFGSAGGIVSTAADLARFGRALLGGKLLSAASVVEMTTPRKGNYGLGWEVGRTPGTLAGGHSGLVPGFSSLINLDAATQIVVVLLSNSSDSRTDQVGENVASLARKQ